jgi:hypothetical protein
MADIRELSFDEIAQVSGGSANGQNASDRNFGRTASTNYGGQANGYQPNISAGITGANMYNDLTSNCGLALVGGTAGLANAAASRSVTGAVSSIAGIIAGCRPDSSSNSKSGPPFH